jgi:aconitate hydratase 2/2-methylisocitrate dehydratase
LGNGANVYLSSAELAAVCSLLGKIPTVEEYMQYAATLEETSADTYRYLNFKQLESYQRKADGVV